MAPVVVGHLSVAFADWVNEPHQNLSDQYPHHTITSDSVKCAGHFLLLVSSVISHHQYIFGVGAKSLAIENRLSSPFTSHAGVCGPLVLQACQFKTVSLPISVYSKCSNNTCYSHNLLSTSFYFYFWYTHTSCGTWNFLTTPSSKYIWIAHITSSNSVQTESEKVYS